MTTCTHWQEEDVTHIAGSTDSPEGEAEGELSDEYWKWLDNYLTLYLHSNADVEVLSSDEDWPTC